MPSGAEFSNIECCVTYYITIANSITASCSYTMTVLIITTLLNVKGNNIYLLIYLYFNLSSTYKVHYLFAVENIACYHYNICSEYTRVSTYTKLRNTVGSMCTIFFLFKFCAMQ